MSFCFCCGVPQKTDICSLFCRVRSQAEQLEKELARRAVRVEPLGRDRDGAEYYVLPGDARLFVRRDGNDWGCYTTNEELTALHDSLSDKGIHERALKKALESLPPLPAPTDGDSPAQVSPLATRRSKRVAGKTEPVHYVNLLAPKSRD